MVAYLESIITTSNWNFGGTIAPGSIREDRARTSYAQTFSSSGPRRPVFDPALPRLVSRASRRWVSRPALAALE
jgi:hypothetical protein